MCSRMSPLPANSIAHMSNAFRFVVVDRQARVVVGDDAPQTAGDRAEQRARLEVGDERVVHLEQQLRADRVPARSSALRLLRGLVVERVVDGQRHLVGELAAGTRRRPAENASSSRLAKLSPPRRRSGDVSGRTQNDRMPSARRICVTTGKRVSRVDVRDDEGLLRLPDDAGGGLATGRSIAVIRGVCRAADVCSRMTSRSGSCRTIASRSKRATRRSTAARSPRRQSRSRHVAVERDTSSKARFRSAATSPRIRTSPTGAPPFPGRLVEHVRYYPPPSSVRPRGSRWALGTRPVGRPQAATVLVRR